MGREGDGRGGREEEVGGGVREGEGGGEEGGQEGESWELRSHGYCMLVSVELGGKRCYGEATRWRGECQGWSLGADHVEGVMRRVGCWG